MAKRVILISVDDLRYDALSCEPDTRYLDRYGLAPMRDTPTLDRLAASGARLTQRRPTTTRRPSAPAAAATGSIHENWLLGVSSTCSPPYSLTNHASAVSYAWVRPASLLRSCVAIISSTRPRRSAAVWHGQV